MSKSKFLEGAILGLLAGVVGAVWLLQDEEDVDCGGSCDACSN